jgi:large subunit ribosomal protein L22
MEVTTIQKYIHATPRKLRLVADMVRKMLPSQALNILQATPKMAAQDLEKALSTVLANAKQQGLDASKLTFSKIEVNESMKMRRFRSGTRGRVKPYKKRMSHIKIVLTDEQGQASRVKGQVEKVTVKEKKEVKEKK